MELKEAIATIAKAAKEIEDKPSGAVQIVVLDRGFVYIGNVTVESDWVLIRNAHNIRVWGTTKGLGELVNGPLSSTKLDQVGTVRAPIRALISLIDVKEAKWTFAS